jgi:hypothetical protein
MTKPDRARRRFLAALALYLAWVGVLAGMAVTSSNRPPETLVPAATGATTPTRSTSP